MSSSSFLARWLYRALLGAAFGRLGWKEFWKRVPIYPPVKPMSMMGFSAIMREHYLDPIREQLSSATWSGMLLDVKKDMNRQAFGDYKPKPYVPPTRTEKLKRKLKYKLKRMKPVLTTRGSIEDKEYDY